MTKDDTPGGIVPEGLVKRLDTMSGWEPPNSPRAEALKEAADVLRTLPTIQKDGERLHDPHFQSHSYRIDSNKEEGEMRLVIFRNSGQKQVLGYMVMTTAESYELAQVVLKNYDQLEGIK